MNIQGIAKKDRKTKNLIPRLKYQEIAVINHLDLDRLCAEGILEKKPKAVINALSSISGKFLNLGPQLLLISNILILDEVGEDCFSKIKEGLSLQIIDNEVFQEGVKLGEGKIITKKILESKIEEARKNLDVNLSSFVENTLGYFKKEKDILFEDISFPDIGISAKKKQVLVVVRGPEYQQDLYALLSYIRDRKPLIIAVDGGADALLDFKIKPHIIVGDMDSVSDKALLCGAKILIHAYPSGYAPGEERVKRLNIDYHLIPFAGTSEDIALLFAYREGCDMIIGVGMHFSLEEFLEKGREGMSSTFLVRLKVGSILFDAKGVGKLYSPTPKLSLLLSLILAGIIPILVIISTSPQAKPFFRLVKILIEKKLGM